MQTFTVQISGLGYITSALVAEVLINSSITNVSHDNQCLSATYDSDWVMTLKKVYRDDS